MNIILLSGGSGKRLWPLSNDIRSKQFLRLFKRGDGASESMVQRVYRQILRADPQAAVTVAAPKAQTPLLQNQLGENIHISVEPARRDTFPAIVLAAAYLHDTQGVSKEEPVVICPVDPYVEDEYFAKVQEMAELAGKGRASLVLMGIEPTYPSEKYGYIIPKSRGAVSEVLAFKEKPDEKTAEEYILRGALWNGGVFACRLGYLLEKARELLGFAKYPELLARYPRFQKISFDYAVVEKEACIQAVRYTGQWKDLGTWNTLTEAMDQNISGKAMMDEACSNVSIVNELDVPILAMGARDMVISAGPEGILVSDKEQSSQIKPFVEQINQQIMYAEKSWGSYRVLNVEEDSLTIKITLLPGRSMNYHRHFCRDEQWIVTSGQGKCVIDGVVRRIAPGDVISLPCGCTHTVIADTEMRLIEVQIGKAITVQDKEKFPMPDFQSQA